MFTFRAGVRAATRAARDGFTKSHTKNPVFYSRQVPHIQPKRFASRYSRFGEPSSNGNQQQQQQPQRSKFGPAYRAQYIWRNYRRPIVVVGAGGGVVYYYNLEEVPITHRRRFNVISPSNEKQLFGGDEPYQQVLQQYQGKVLPANHPMTVQVARVVERLLPTTGGLAGEDWRVHVIDEPQEKNAFVMPGGKVFVFSGILPICQDENGLAAVLGHEIAHNVAHHAAERISRSSFVMLGAFAFSFLFDVSGQFGSSIANFALSLPNSRTQEAEADHIGLLMMAEACYDPKAAPEFWVRMKKAEQFSPPQFLSTHPSPSNRTENLKRLLPEAQRIYDDTACGTTSHHSTGFFEALKSGQLTRRGQTNPQQPATGRQRDDDDDFF